MEILSESPDKKAALYLLTKYDYPNLEKMIANSPNKNNIIKNLIIFSERHEKKHHMHCYITPFYLLHILDPCDYLVGTYYYMLSKKHLHHAAVYFIRKAETEKLRSAIKNREVLTFFYMIKNADVGIFNKLCSVFNQKIINMLINEIARSSLCSINYYEQKTICAVRLALSNGFYVTDNTKNICRCGTCLTAFESQTTCIVRFI